MCGTVEPAVVENYQVVILTKDQILKILPHRGKWLLLDSVRLEGKRATGELLLTEEICHGHIIGGRLMAPGCIWFDMAAQFLGIIAHNSPEVITSLNGRSRSFGVFRYGEAEFRRPVCPGEKVLIQTDSGVTWNERHGIFTVSSGPFFIRAEGSDKFRIKIGFVTLIRMG